MNSLFWWPILYSEEASVNREIDNEIHRVIDGSEGLKVIISLPAGIEAQPGIEAQQISRRPAGTSRQFDNVANLPGYSISVLGNRSRANSSLLLRPLQMFPRLHGFGAVGIAFEDFAPGGAVVGELLCRPIEEEPDAFAVVAIQAVVVQVVAKFRRADRGQLIFCEASGGVAREFVGHVFGFARVHRE